MKEQKKVFQNHRYCKLFLESERQWCHMYVFSPFQVKNTFKVCESA